MLGTERFTMSYGVSWMITLGSDHQLCIQAGTVYGAEDKNKETTEMGALGRSPRTASSAGVSAWKRGFINSKLPGSVNATRGT